MKIAQMLPIAFVACAIVVGVSASIISNYLAGGTINDEINDKLNAVLSARSSQMNTYLGSIQEDLTVIAASPVTAAAVQDFSAAWRTLGGNQTVTLKNLYINSNPYPLGEKDKLYDANDGSVYSATHAQYHPWFHELQQTREYYDVFLFDTNGDLVYSVFKENDYATNFRSRGGEWSETDLGVVFRSAMTLSAGSQVFEDFEPYAPSADAPAAFIGQPIIDANGTRVGVLVFQMPIGRINAIMGNRDGMGETGEAYIVGADGLMRSDSRFSDTSTILVEDSRVDSGTFHEARSGRSGIDVIEDYRGVEVISAYTPFEFMGSNWAILAEIDVAEAEAGLTSMTNTLIMVTIFLILVVGFLGFLLARNITGAIGGITKVMTVLAGGNHEIEVPHTDRHDEIGEIADAVQVFKENAIEQEKLQAEATKAAEVTAQRERDDLEREAEDRKREAAEADAEAQREREAVEREREAAASREVRAKLIADLIVDFENAVQDVVGTVTAAATELEATAKSMETMANDAQTQATTVAEASQEASGNVEAVAAASEEMSASVDEISNRVTESSRITSEAAEQADNTNVLMTELAETANQIGDVVSFITDIAEQTNLLALNATIEAARAGDAGKGFAVVATEVKSLADQTGKATEEIAAQINGIQQKTTDATNAVGSIREVISRTNEVASSIASAVEEQGAATREISRNAQQAAAGTDQVTSSIGMVTEGANQTKDAASQVLVASQEMARNGDTLKNVIDKFLDDIRAA